MKFGMFVVAAWAALSLVACSETAPGEDVDQVDSAKKVKPVGTQTAGKLKVVLPAGVSEASLSGYAPAGYSKIELFAKQGSTEVVVPLGTEVSLAPGSVCLRLRVGHMARDAFSTWGESYAEGATDCALSISANLLTTYTLAVVDFKRSEDVFGIGDIFKTYNQYNPGSEPRPTCERRIVAAGDTSSLMGCGVEASTKRPLLPGSYRYAWGINDGFTTTIAAGDVKTIDFADTTKRRVTRISAPTRENKDASGITLYEIEGQGKKLSRALAAAQAIQVGQADGGPDVAHTIAIVSAAARQVMPLDFPAAAGPVAKLEIGRIDVDDVAVTSGAVASTVAGTYLVDRQNGPTYVPLVLAPAGWPTATGLDVLPGLYRVTTTFKRLDGTTGTDVQSVTIP